MSDDAKTSHHPPFLNELTAESTLSTSLLRKPVTGPKDISRIIMTVGNFLGGKLADWNVGRALTGIAIAIAIVSLALRWSSPALIPAEINWFLWGVVTFAAIPASQVNVMRFGQQAPNLVSTLNISAFNIGIAIGAWIGGTVLATGYSLAGIPVAAAAVAALAWIATVVAETLSRHSTRKSRTLQISGNR